MGARSKRRYKTTSVSWGEDGKGEGEGEGGGGKGCRDAATTTMADRLARALMQEPPSHLDPDIGNGRGGRAPKMRELLEPPAQWRDQSAHLDITRAATIHEGPKGRVDHRDVFGAIHHAVTRHARTHSHRQAGLEEEEEEWQAAPTAEPDTSRRGGTSNAIDATAAAAAAAAAAGVARGGTHGTMPCGAMRYMDGQMGTQEDVNCGIWGLLFRETQPPARQGRSRAVPLPEGYSFPRYSVPPSITGTYFVWPLLSQSMASGTAPAAATKASSLDGRAASQELLVPTERGVAKTVRESELVMECRRHVLNNTKTKEFEKKKSLPRHHVALAGAHLVRTHCTAAAEARAPGGVPGAKWGVHHPCPWRICTAFLNPSVGRLPPQPPTAMRIAGVPSQTARRNKAD
ncbi:hypothetical protein Purlil1_735 [Purpureocillium lilacinum]|uniref:Uncharacterized protein n=1 Tax=Purpureocillium lilacinum TaxID=33203 RepID=A0ABR0CF41_PURLI|nr:hypothetical protein Purlil1_735 [Purpureocillium lilacinum]